MPRTTRIFAAAAAVLGTALTAPAVSTAAPPPATPTTNSVAAVAAIAACKTGEDPTENRTNFYTTQQASGSACQVGSTWTVTATVWLRELRPDFNHLAVVGCSAHMKLTHIGGSAQDKPVTCTSDAKKYSTFPTTQTFTGLGPGSYRVSSWVNIQAGTHHEAYPYRSEWTFSVP